MYTSQSMLILTLLLLLTAALYYHTIDLQQRQIVREMEATSVDLKSSSVEHVVSTSLSPTFNKVLNDASLKVANEGFFSSPEDVVNYLERNTEDHIRSYLDNVSRYYSNQGYNFTYSFDITNITMADGFTFKIDYVFSYNLSYRDGTINKTDSIESSQYVTVKTVLDAYHYRKPTYIMPIHIYNPNNENLTDFQVKIILDESNFDFSIDPDGTGLKFIDENNNYIPYWIEYWRDSRAIIWIKIPELEANQIITVYLISTYPRLSESNGNLVFELFDDFEYNRSIGIKWNNLYGDWKFYNFGNNYLLYNPLYNRQVIGCENAPPVARIISINNISLKNYIIEVVAKGNNTYYIKKKVWWWWEEYPYPAPNIMIGYLADPHYFWYTTLHPDAFYTFDLGGRYKNDGYALTTEDIYMRDLYWLDEVKRKRRRTKVENFEGVMICKEYPSSKIHNYREKIEGTNAVLPEKNKWYIIKILITEKEVDGSTVKEVKGTYTPLEDYILYNYENPWLITKTIEEPYGNHFLLGTSWGDHDLDGNQEVYFDNFRVRKYAPQEPYVSVTGNMIRIYPLIYISPPRAYGTYYGEGTNPNPYFVEDPSGEHPSIVDMLAGRDKREWKYGYSIKLIGFYLPEK